MRNSSTGELLLSFIQRLEGLDEQRRALVAEMSGVKAEAKSAGFDLKAIGQMLRERRMTADERQDYAALCAIYRAALGMLDGTPLGEAARKRWQGDPPPAAPPPSGDAADPAPEAAAEPPEPPPEPPPIDLPAARAAGAAAAQAGLRVTENPHPFNDPHRAAWDEGWCGSAGSDGMDIPAAFRRGASKPPPPPAPEPPPPTPAKPAPAKRGGGKQAGGKGGKK